MVAQMLGRVALFLHWLVTISLLPGVPGWWRYILLACLVAAEGPMATLLGAAAAASGVMQLPGVYLAAVIGNLTADTLWYLLGRGGKTRWLRWMEGRAGLSPEQSQYIQEHLQRRATRWIFVAKLTAGLMIPTLVAAGLLRIPWRKWFPAVFAGELIWSTSLVLLGYFATGYLRQIARGIEFVAIGGVLIFLLAGLFLLRRTALQQIQSARPHSPVKRSQTDIQ